MARVKQLLPDAELLALLDDRPRCHRCSDRGYVVVPATPRGPWLRNLQCDCPAGMRLFGALADVERELQEASRG